MDCNLSSISSVVNILKVPLWLGGLSPTSCSVILGASTIPISNSLDLKSTDNTLESEVIASCACLVKIDRIEPRQEHLDQKILDFYFPFSYTASRDNYELLEILDQRKLL
jgi:hypothetical protein